MAAATSLVRVFESTIQSASVMTDDMSHLDMLYAFKITSKLQEHMFEILVQMLSNELTSKPSMPTLHDPFRKSNAFLNHPGSNKSSFNIGNRSHLNTLKRRQKKFNLPQRTPLTQTHRPVHNVPVSSVEGNSISLLEESVLMNPIGEQQPSTSQIPNSNPSLFDTSISLKSHENSMITQNQNETSKDEVENPHTENSAIVDENFAMADQVMLANQSTDNNHFNNSEQHKSFFSQDEIQLIEIKDEEDVMEDMSKDEDNVDLNFSTNLGDLKYASLAQIPGPSNSKSSESPSQLVGSTDAYFEMCSSSTEWQRKHCCFVCKKLVSKIGRHLEMHRDVPEVREAMSLPKKHAERLRMLTLMMYKGDYFYNMQKLNQGQANDIIVIHRIPGADVSQYVPCPACLGFMTKSRLQRHLRKNCPSIPNLQYGGDF